MTPGVQGLGNAGRRSAPSSTRVTLAFQLSYLLHCHHFTFVFGYFLACKLHSEEEGDLRTRKVHVVGTVD